MRLKKALNKKIVLQPYQVISLLFFKKIHYFQKTEAGSNKVGYKQKKKFADSYLAPKVINILISLSAIHQRKQLKLS